MLLHRLHDQCVHLRACLHAANRIIPRKRNKIKLLAKSEIYFLFKTQSQPFTDEITPKRVEMMVEPSQSPKTPSLHSRNKSKRLSLMIEEIKSDEELARKLLKHYEK